MKSTLYLVSLRNNQVQFVCLVNRQLNCKKYRNIKAERSIGTLKYEEVYLHEYEPLEYVHSHTD